MFAPFISDLEKNMKVCKDQFKEFERKDVKYREDLRHLKQKIKRHISLLPACGLVDYLALLRSCSVPTFPVRPV